MNIITIDLTEPGMVIMSYNVTMSYGNDYTHRTGNVINIPGRHNDSTPEVCIPGRNKSCHQPTSNAERNSAVERATSRPAEIR